MAWHGCRRPSTHGLHDDAMCHVLLPTCACTCHMLLCAGPACRERRDCEPFVHVRSSHKAQHSAAQIKHLRCRCRAWLRLRRVTQSASYMLLPYVAGTSEKLPTRDACMAKGTAAHVTYVRTYGMRQDIFHGKARIRTPAVVQAHRAARYERYVARTYNLTRALRKSSQLLVVLPMYRHVSCICAQNV